MINSRETVITGIGILSAYGSGKELFWNGIADGISGIRDIAGIKTAPLLSRKGGQISDFKLEKASRMLARANNYCKYSYHTANQAVKDAGISSTRVDSYRKGCLLGSNFAHPVVMQYADMGDLMRSQYIYPNIGTSLIAIDKGINGPIMSIANGESSGSASVELGMNLIKWGKCDVVIVGGTDVLSRMALLHYGQLKEISPNREDQLEKCTPYDEARNGIVLAEGSGFLVLENSKHAKMRGAKSYCKISGAGSSNISRLNSCNGKSSIEYAMIKAIADSSKKEADIGLIYGSGNGSRSLDIAEMKGIQTVFQKTKRPPIVSSIKSLTGETQSAGGIFNIAAAIYSFISGRVIPTAGFRSSDSDVNIAATPVSMDGIDSILCNSMSFGGNSVSLVLSKE